MAMEFAEQVQDSLPSRVDIYGARVDTIDKAVEGDAEAQVLYAAQMAGLENGLKRAQGELDGLGRSDAVAKRAADEAAMLAWFGKQRDSKSALADIKAAQALIAAPHATSEDRKSTRLHSSH